ncbi:unnamed protein product [Allacma fusca]|uniref:Co-chaperone HscB C-terminal oligomerisation domain-containing protein n=1 Tax=Allacma fusca TaxID=39272 RepID=A0A8J2JZI6_9HEXA|nr:unnamed protein product [Allacma fusca]
MLKRIIAPFSFSRVFREEIKSGDNFAIWSSTSQRRFCSAVSGSCWKCGQKLAENQFSLQCPACQSLRKFGGEDVNYFKIFGAKETYRIDLSKLSMEMKILQKNLHPDLFSLKTKEEQELSESLSSLVNKAYSTLQNPIERAQYMLERRGINSEMLETKMTTDVEFLMEVMELNERLDEIEDSKDWAEFRRENNEKILELNGKLEDAFEKENIDEAMLILAKMKYYGNLQDKLKKLQSRLGVVD